MANNNLEICRKCPYNVDGDCLPNGTRNPDSMARCEGTFENNEAMTVQYIRTLKLDKNGVETINHNQTTKNSK